MKAVCSQWTVGKRSGSRNTCLHAFPQLLALGWGVETCVVEGSQRVRSAEMYSCTDPEGYMWRLRVVTERKNVIYGFVL